MCIKIFTYIFYIIIISLNVERLKMVKKSNKEKTFHFYDTIIIVNVKAYRK